MVIERIAPSFVDLPDSDGEHYASSAIEMFNDQMKRSPILNREQEKLLFCARKSGLKNLDLTEREKLENAVNNPGFWKGLSSRDVNLFEAAISECQSIDSLLVFCNTRMVAGEARKRLGKGVPLEDLIQEGLIGLNRAIGKFDVARGFKFSTYAMWWVRQSIRLATLDDGKIVRLPSQLVVDLGKVAAAVVGFENANNGRTPDEQELMEFIEQQGLKMKNLNLGRVLGVYGSGIAVVTSLEQQIYGEGDDEIILGNAIRGNEDTEREGLEKIMADELMSLIERIVREGYPPRKKRSKLPSSQCCLDIFKLRRGLTDGDRHTIAKVKEKIKELHCVDLPRGKLAKIDSDIGRLLRNDPRIRDFLT